MKKIMMLTLQETSELFSNNCKDCESLTVQAGNEFEHLLFFSEQFLGDLRDWSCKQHPAISL